MAIIESRLKIKTDTGFDTYHVETGSNIVLRDNLIVSPLSGSIEESFRALEDATMYKLFSGARSKIYKICTYIRGTGSSSAGECILYSDRASAYGNPSTSTWYIDYNGNINETIFGNIDSYNKNIMIYKSDVDIISTTIFTVYLEAPNYNDNWSLYVKKATNCSFNIVDVTDTWDAEIANKYLSSRTVISRQQGYGLCTDGVLYKNLAQLDSPIFTGTPTAITAPDGTNTTQLATCKFVINNSSKFLVSASQPTNQNIDDFWLEPV